MDESGTDEAECSRQEVSGEWNGRRAVGAIRSLVNAKDLQLVCASLT